VNIPTLTCTTAAVDNATTNRASYNGPGVVTRRPLPSEPPPCVQSAAIPPMTQQCSISGRSTEPPAVCLRESRTVGVFAVTKPIRQAKPIAPVNCYSHGASRRSSSFRRSATACRAAETAGSGETATACAAQKQPLKAKPQPPAQPQKQPLRRSRSRLRSRRTAGSGEAAAPAQPKNSRLRRSRSRLRSPKKQPSGRSRQPPRSRRSSRSGEAGSACPSSETAGRGETCARRKGKEK